MLTTVFFLEIMRIVKSVFRPKPPPILLQKVQTRFNLRQSLPRRAAKWNEELWRKMKAYSRLFVWKSNHSNVVLWLLSQQRCAYVDNLRNHCRYIVIALWTRAATHRRLTRNGLDSWACFLAVLFECVPRVGVSNSSSLQQYKNTTN